MAPHGGGLGLLAGIEDVHAQQLAGSAVEH
jgi:hypothetical protein